MLSTTVSNRYSSGRASRTIARTAGRSYGSTPRPSAKVSSFSVTAATKRSGRASNACFSPVTPSNVAPFGRPPAASIGAPSYSLGPPAADRVEVLHRQPDRIHQHVARRAGRVRAMLYHPLAHRRHVILASGFLQRRHAWRRRRRRRSDDVLEHPFAAKDRRRPVGVRGREQNAALSKQPAAHAVGGKRDAPELRAVHVRIS